MYIQIKWLVIGEKGLPKYSIQLSHNFAKINKDLATQHFVINICDDIANLFSQISQREKFLKLHSLCLLLKQVKRKAKLFTFCVNVEQPRLANKICVLSWLQRNNILEKSSLNK